jgi:hypothetical protein
MLVKMIKSTQGGIGVVIGRLSIVGIYYRLKGTNYESRIGNDRRTDVK